MRTQHQSRPLATLAAAGIRDVEGVLHRPGRVVRGEIERVEVEPLGLEFRAVGDLPAHRNEDVGNFVGDHRHRVPGPDPPPVVRQGDVDGFVDQHPGIPFGEQHLLAGGQRVGHLAPRGADQATGRALGLLGQATDGPVGQGQRRLVAHRGRAGPS